MKRLLPGIVWTVCFLQVSAWAPPARAQSYTISTAVGAGPPSNVLGTSTSLAFGQPSFLTADLSGNVFFVDQNAVIEMNAATGQLSVVAGNGTTGYSGDGGPATSAQLNNPQGLAVDSNGNLYIADAGNNVIRKVSGGVISTVAGNGSPGSGCPSGPALSAQFNSPAGLAVDSSGNLYIADTEHYCVRELANGTISTVAGNGVPGFGGDNGKAVNAMLSYSVVGIAVDSSGNLYIADGGNERVREVAKATGNITTVAGTGNCCTFNGDGGPATSAELANPLSVAVDSAGDIFIADSRHQAIREVSNGIINTVAGNNGLGAGFSGDAGAANQAQLSSPQFVAVDGSGNLYIADQGNNRIREVSHAVIDTVVGNGLIGDNGPATAAQLASPFGIGLDPAGNLYIADNEMLRIRRVDAATGVITTVAGNGTQGTGIVNGSPATGVGLNSTTAVAADKNGNIYIANGFGYTILEVSGGLISNFAGNGTNGYNGDGGPAASAEIGNTFGLAVDSQINVYLSDNLESSDATAARVREVSNGTIDTAVGNGNIGSTGDGGPATKAELQFPTGLAVDLSGNLYIADLYNNNIRKVSNGIITTVAGNGQASFSGDGGPATLAALNNPGGVAVDSQGNIYIADSGNNRIRMVSAATGKISTIAGNGTLGYTGDYGPATSAELSSPIDVAVNAAGSVLVADSPLTPGSGGRIRVLTPTGSACSYSGVPSTLQVAAAGGSQSIAVQTTAFCPWSISGLPSWITLASSSMLTGPGSAGLTVAPNTGSSRSATITIAGTAVAVTQSASGPNPCDINQDGVVNVLDVQLLIKQALGLSAVTNDLTGDQIVNVVDVQLDSDAAVGLGCSAK